MQLRRSLVIEPLEDLCSNSPESSRPSITWVAWAHASTRTVRPIAVSVPLQIAGQPV